MGYVGNHGEQVISDQLRYWLENGQVFSLTGSATSTALSNAAIMLWGGAQGITKNTVILSALFGNAAGNNSIGTFRTLTATDAAVANNQTPVNWKAGGPASLYTGANAAVNLPTATAQAYSGTVIRNVLIPNTADVEIMPLDGYVIPANSANVGIEVVLAQGTLGLYTVNLVWAEYSI